MSGPASPQFSLQRAFVLGAGLGTRLRPLTFHLPKPLIPLHHRPLLEYAFDHLHGAGAREFVINTHHLPEAYSRAFPEGRWQKCPLTFRHEPVVLETGGGLANIRDLLDGRDPFFVYNGDVYADFPLQPAIEQHHTDGNLVTLILRSSGAVRNVAWDSRKRRVVDVRNVLGTNSTELYQFTGIYLVDPGFFRYLPPGGTVETVVNAWLRAMQDGARLGGIVIDDGLWLDLGDRASYLAAHRLVPCATPVHPTARVAETARLEGTVSIGPDCVVEAGAALRDSVLWPGARVDSGAELNQCIVMSGHTAGGLQTGTDV